MVIRDGDSGRRGRKSEGSAADTARKRPAKPWTAARAMEVLRRCPLSVAQRLVLGQGHKDNVRCIAVEEQLEAKGPTFAVQLQLPTHDLFWANLKVQLHLPPLDLLIF